MRRWAYRRRCKQRSLRNRLILMALRKRRAATRGVNRQHVCRWKFGSWNVRQWGAVDVPYDPWTKTQCLFRMANKRGWHAIMLSDVNLGANGTMYVKVDGKEWGVVVRGNVALAMDGPLTAERAGQRYTWHEQPRRGWSWCASLVLGVEKAWRW